MNTINLNGFEKAQLSPREGEIREWKDGKYQFIDGKWNKIKLTSDLTLEELPAIFEKLDKLAKTGKPDDSVKYFSELRKKHPDLDEKIDVYQKQNKLGKYHKFEESEDSKLINEFKSEYLDYDFKIEPNKNKK
jgi:hypothetical protein